MKLERTTWMKGIRDLGAVGQNVEAEDANVGDAVAEDGDLDVAGGVTELETG